MNSHTGNTQPSIDQEEHRSVNGVNAKAVIPYVLSGTNSNPVPLGGKLVTEAFDYVSRALTNSTTETYTYKSGGAAGTSVATVVVVYTDSTLATISTVTRT